MVLPAIGKPDSEFAKEIGDALAPRNCWFNYGEQVVAVRVIQLGNDYEFLGSNRLHLLRREQIWSSIFKQVGSKKTRRGMRCLYHRA